MWASSAFVLALAAFVPALVRGVLVIRGCGRLDIAAGAITSVSGRGTTVTLSREQGDVLQVGGSASAQWGNTRYLTIQGASTRILLNLYK